MRVSFSTTAILATISLFASVESFSTNSVAFGRRTCVLMETAAADVAEAAPVDEQEEAAPATAPEDEIPTNLPSDIGMDYVPLATMLATGQFEEADQVGAPDATFCSGSCSWRLSCSSSSSSSSSSSHTMLQFTRDALITLAGSKDAGRNFVYFTEVKRIPSTDLATIERLWNRFSKGKFGYSVQKVRRCWSSAWLCVVSKKQGRLTKPV